MFNSILREADIALADVRLLRHKDQRATKAAPSVLKTRWNWPGTYETDI